MIKYLAKIYIIEFSGHYKGGNFNIHIQEGK